MGENTFLSVSNIMRCSKWDSGGPVYIVTDVVNGNITCKLLGIVAAGIVDENTGQIVSTAFSKYYYIVNELGIEAITE